MATMFRQFQAIKLETTYLPNSNILSLENYNPNYPEESFWTLIIPSNRVIPHAYECHPLTRKNFHHMGCLPNSHRSHSSQRIKKLPLNPGLTTSRLRYISTGDGGTRSISQRRQAFHHLSPSILAELRFYLSFEFSQFNSLRSAATGVVSHLKSVGLDSE
ncbi:hypothetical protein TNCV_381521 [Trichonephila clavipes]|uniref:Uncharacterized protein n=1 Tax=Trichonephila clavipes TaxID=2585209 RepID=A0A8X6SI85_TRICX|nr:hypothetical protein TNCV_381521 [Trichonephila clavipes]